MDTIIEVLFFWGLGLIGLTLFSFIVWVLLQLEFDSDCNCCRLARRKEEER